MNIRVSAALAVSAFALTACSGGSGVSDAAFCDAAHAWGDDLTSIGTNMTALGNLLDSATDPADPAIVSAMHDAATEVLGLADQAQTDAETAIANVSDPAVADAIRKADSLTVDLAVVMGEAARDSATVDEFSSAILAHISVFQDAANYDLNEFMTVVGDYGQTRCATAQPTPQATS